MNWTVFDMILMKFIILYTFLNKWLMLSFILLGQEIKVFLHKNYVTCVQFHPTDPALFLAGTFKSAILCWDKRTGNVSSQ